MPRASSQGYVLANPSVKEIHKGIPCVTRRKDSHLITNEGQKRETNRERIVSRRRRAWGRDPAPPPDLEAAVADERKIDQRGNER